MIKEDLENELKKVLEIIKGNIKLENGTAEIDISNILELNHELYESILNDPERLIPSIEEALKCIFLNELKVKLSNINNPIEISKIRVNKIDNLVSVKGILKRVTKVIPRTVSIEFQCMNCGSTITVPQNKKVIRKPQNRCAGCGSMNKFEVNKNNNKDIQEVTLEEIQENLEGKQPQQIRVYLEGDLTDSSMTSRLQPGRKVEIIGVIKRLPAFMSSKDEELNVSEFMINTNNIISLEGDDDLTITEEDEKQIKEIASNNPLERLSKNLVPEIYGNNMIKKAVVLQMVKGVPKKRADGNIKQSDLHILLIGDVGCVSGDSYVTLADGSFIKIKEMGNNHLEKINQKVLVDRINQFDKSYALADTIFIYENKPTKRIVTETGKEIICSYNHPLLVKRKAIDRVKQSEWVCANLLNIGDKIKVMTKINCTKNEYEKLFYDKLCYNYKIKYKKPDYCNEEISLLFGYGLGDGWNDKYRTIFVVNNDEKDIIKMFDDILHKNFKLNLKIKLIKPSKYKHKIGNREIKSTQQLYYLSIDSKEISSIFKFIKQKEVPSIIMKSKDSVVASFLGGLFEADGCCFIDSGECPTISLSSSRPVILKQVQLLLLRFGIQSRINGVNLQIKRAKDIISYYMNIGFLSEKKEKKLKEVYNCSLKKNYNLRKLIKFEKIKMIEEGGIQRVYDIQVKEKHRFISNGIISHNSAKSQMLKAVSIKSPKSKMIVGTKTSRVALGAMAVKDEMLGTWALESGAIVLCNNGSLCLDEMEKMGKEHLSDLLEPMSSATVTVSKAGIHAVLPANTNILAAANPVHGNYDLSQPLAKQIDLPTPILNRFDLIFVIIDKPNEVFDTNIIEHVFKSYNEKPKIDISNELFKKYIVYSKKLKPKLSPELLKPLQDFYVNIRKKSDRNNTKGVPVNMRSIEGLIKLAEANAKLRLSEIVERQDLEVAKEILLFCLAQIGYDEESGIYDLSKITEKVPFSKRGKVQTFWQIIKNLSDKTGKNLNYSDIIYEAKKLDIDKWDCDNYIEELKKDIKIIEPEKGVYQIV